MGGMQKIVPESTKALPKQAIELLIDMLDNKLTCLEVIDREDVRELKLMRDTMDQLENWLVEAPTSLETGRRGRRRQINALSA